MNNLGIFLRQGAVFLLCALWPLSALAAPFCVEVQGINPQCEYYDAAQCRQRAIQLSGRCAANRAELTLRSGTGKYCLVDSSRSALCAYADLSSCDSDAARNGGVCIDNTPPGIQPDPYQADPNRKY